MENVYVIFWFTLFSSIFSELLHALERNLNPHVLICNGGIYMRKLGKYTVDNKLKL